MHLSGQPASKTLLPILSLVVLVISFIVDLLIPAGIAIWVLYVISIGIAMLSGRPRSIEVATILAAAFAILAYFFAPGSHPAEGLINRSLGVLGLSSAGWFFLRQARVNESLKKEQTTRAAAERELRELNRDLDVRVRQRTEQLEIEIAERRAIEQALLLRQDQLTEFLTTAAPPMFWISPWGRVDWANGTLLELLGASQRAVSGKRVTDFVIDPDAAAEIESRLASGSPISEFEARLRAADGSVRHVVMNSARMPDGFTPAGICVFVLDMTENIIYQESLRRSEERFRLAFESSRILAWEWDQASDKVTISESGSEGVWSSLRTGKRALELIHPEDRRRVVRTIAQAANGMGQYRTEYRIRVPGTQKTLWIEGRGEAGRNPKTGKLHITGIAIDITERKRIEESLLESEARKTAMFESALDAVVTIDDDGRILEFNPAAETMFGYAKHEVMGKHMAEMIIPPAMRLAHYAGLRGYLVSGKSRMIGKRIEISAMRADGSEFPVEASITPVRVKGRHIFTAFLRDISERKQAELKLREQAELIDLAQDPIITFDLDDRITFWSRGAEQTYGWKQDEVIGRKIQNVLKPEFPDRLESIRSELLNKGVWSGEVMHTLRSGERRVMMSRFAIAHNRAGQPERILEVMRDITARKTAEDALRESERNYRLLFDQNPNPMWVCELNSLRFLAVNDAALRHYGFSREEFLGMTAESLRPTARVLSLHQNAAQAVEHPAKNKAAGAATEIVTHLTKSGRQMQVEITHNLIDYEGKPALLVLAKDVTERLRTEQALRESTRRLEFLSEAAGRLLMDDDPNSLLDELFARLAEMLDLEIYVHFEMSSDGDLRLAKSAGLPDEVKATIHRLRLGEAVCGTVALERSPHVVSDVQSSTDPKTELIRRLGVTAYACHPLIAHDRLVGTLSFGSRKTKQFSAEAISFMRTACDYVASAIERHHWSGELRESEQRFRQLADAVPSFVWTSDPGGRRNYFNSRWYDYTGLTREASIDGGWTQAVHPDDVQAVESAWEQARAEGDFFESELRLRGADGTYRWFLARAVPYRDPNGQMIAWFGVSNDIEQKKRAEANAKFIAEHNERLVKIIDPTEMIEITIQKVCDFLKVDRCGLLAVDLVSGTYTVAHENQCGEHSTRGTYGIAEFPADLTAKLDAGQTIVIDDVESHPSFSPEQRELMSRMHVRSLIDVPRRRDGDLVAILAVASNSPRKWREDEIALMNSVADSLWFSLETMRLLGSLRDSESRYRQAAEESARLNRELARQVRQLESANRELDSFSYTVSHDLRQPLRAVQGYAEMLLDDYREQLDENGRELLDQVSESAEKMNALINDLLSFSRFSRQNIEKQTVNVRELVTSVWESLKDDASKVRVDFRVGELPRAEGDESMIRQVFVNLLSNALKFSRNCEAPVVEVGSYPSEKGSVYFVRDNGAGFDMAYVDKLFNIFKRLHRQEEYEGTGVGLAIVQRIVHRHGGDIWAESKVGEGATFFFTLTES